MDKKNKIPKKGNYKTKLKFLEFIGGKGFVNFISHEAIIEANQLSGLGMDGIKLKLTICDDSSVNIDEVDTNLTTEPQRKRLLEIIEEKTIGSFRSRTVIQELGFTSVTQVKDQNVPLYLSVEVTKPIETLANVMDNPLQASKQALGKLSELLDTWLVDDEEEEVVSETQNVVEIMKDHDIPNNNVAEQIKSSFDTMKLSKLNDLKSSKLKKEEELSKLNFQLNTTRNRIVELENEIKLNQDRIDDLKPTEDSTGYFFNVSERLNEQILLEPEIEKIIKEKVSKIKSINVENFMKLFTDGEFHITLGKIQDDELVKVDDVKSLPIEINERLYSLDLNPSDGKFIYVGDLVWSQLVNKMIKMGFEENSEFNKICGSNSYNSTTQTKETLKQNKPTF